MTICNMDAMSFLQINGAEPPLQGRRGSLIDPLDIFCGDLLCSAGTGAATDANGINMAPVNGNGCIVATTVTGKKFVKINNFREHIQLFSISFYIEMLYFI